MAEKTKQPTLDDVAKVVAFLFQENKLILEELAKINKELLTIKNQQNEKEKQSTQN